jgi:hypothetical protein
MTRIGIKHSIVLLHFKSCIEGAMSVTVLIQEHNAERRTITEILPDHTCITSLTVHS